MTDKIKPCVAYAVVDPNGKISVDEIRGTIMDASRLITYHMARAGYHCVKVRIESVED